MRSPKNGENIPIEKSYYPFVQIISVFLFAHMGGSDSNPHLKIIISQRWREFLLYNLAYSISKEKCHGFEL